MCLKVNSIHFFTTSPLFATSKATLSFKQTNKRCCSLLLTLLKLFSAYIIAFLQGGIRFPAFQPFLLSQHSRGTKSMGHLNRDAGTKKGLAFLRDSGSKKTGVQQLCGRYLQYCQG